VRENKSHISLAALAYAPLLKYQTIYTKNGLNSLKTQNKTYIRSFRYRLYSC